MLLGGGRSKSARFPNIYPNICLNSLTKGEAYVAMSSIRAKDLATGRLIDGFFDMFYKDRIQGKIQMKVQYIPKSKLSGKLCEEIPDAYFPLRKNNRLTLYQDAETLPSPRVMFLHYNCTCIFLTYLILLSSNIERRK